MDTTKQDAFCVVNFPPDIWAYVTWYLSGEDLGRLKMTGSTILWHKMLVPGVVTSTNLGKDVAQFKSWPAFLNEFPSIKEVSVYSQTAYWWSLFDLRLTSVPSTLRTLHFSGKIDENCLFFVGDRGVTLNLADHLPHLECLDLACSSMENYTWMAFCPQSLIKLSIGAWDGTVTLPPSLTFLRVSVIDFSKGPTEATFPAELEILFAGMVKRLDFLLPLLPPSIRQFSYSGATYTAIETIFRQFPRTLSSLNLYCPKQEFLQRRALVSLLPPTLTKLVVHSILQNSMWPCLPQTLKSLSFCASRFSCTVVSRTVELPITKFVHEVRSYPFETLPRSITHLEVDSSSERSFCGPPSESCDSYFPPQLTYLSIHDLQLAPGAAKFLPSSLTILSLNNLCERVAEYLPQGLTDLYCPNTLMSPRLIKLLPKSLTALDLLFVGEVNYWFDHDTGVRIESLAELPEYRSHKKLLSNFDWKDISLPPRLTHLYFFSYTEIGDSFIVNQRLPNLLELEIEGTSSLTDLCIPFLNPHITCINLPKSSGISGKCFPHLPRYLTSLSLRSSHSIFDSDIQHLPRTLKVLDMASAVHLTDICIPDLPPRLEYLFLNQNEKITLASLPNFPYPLQSTTSYTWIKLAKWEKDHENIVTLE